nr:glycosyl transferase family protein [uncultured Holophaga sp.]
MWLTLLAWLAAFTNLAILVSSCDDFFVDAYFWVRELYRSLTIRRTHPPLRLEQLQEKPETALALMVPAWREFSVIGEMVETATTVLDYDKYDIFIGTYPNDPETCAEVDRLARRFRRVHRVQVPHDGPTSKADCLNWVIQAIFQFEEQRGERFAGIILHDSEDVIHPLELKLFNYLVDRKDLVQLPVLSLEREWSEWVAGTYQDDFAEWHGKDLVVRESLTGLVPCAGVGACYSRRAIEALCQGTDNQPFNTDTLTEDYDFSFRLKELGMSQVFVKVPVAYPVRVRRLLGGTREVVRSSLVGVREYFPHQFRAAYRQRARWILGIGLQGWQILGWPGGLAARYLLFRDRKGLFTSLVTIFGYVLFLSLGGVYIAGRLGLVTRFPPLLHPGSWVVTVMYINALFMANRILQRFIFVSKLFGVIQGILSIPRIIVGNILNFASACRAWRLFIGHLITGRRLSWDKTVHSFPTHAELLPLRRKLGEILLAWNHLDKDQLDVALTEQADKGLPLGSILLERAWIDEETLADAIAEQSRLSRSTVTPETLTRHRDRLPLAMALRHSLVPLGSGELEEELIGVTTPPSEATAEALHTLFTRPPRFFIITESERAQAMAYLATGRMHPRSAGRRLLGDLLIQRGYITRKQLDTAIASYQPERDGRLGSHLVSLGHLDPEALQGVILEQNARQAPDRAEV